MSFNNYYLLIVLFNRIMDLEQELTDFFEEKIYSESTFKWLKNKLAYYMNNSKEVMLETYYSGYGKYLNATETAWPLYLTQFKSVNDFLNYPSGNMMESVKIPERYRDLLEFDLIDYIDLIRKEAKLLYTKQTSDENFSFLWNYIALSSSYSVEKILGTNITSASIELFLGRIPKEHSTLHWKKLRDLMSQLKNKENIFITFSFQSFALQVTGESLIEESIITNLKRIKEYQVVVTIKKLTNIKYDEIVCYKQLGSAIITGDNKLEEIEPDMLRRLVNDPMTQDALGISEDDTLFTNFSQIIKILHIELE